MSGCGINCEAICIRYAQNTHPADGYEFGFIASRAEFGPGCREVTQRATPTNAAFICQVLTPTDAINVVHHLGV